LNVVLSLPPAAPAAFAISVEQALALLDGPFAELAGGIADGQYAFWLGSAISRDAVDDVRELVRRVLRHLREQADFAVADCAYREALMRALALAELSEADRAGFDPAAPFADWPDPLVQTLLSRLAGRYSRLLNIPVRGQAADFLLWNIVDVPAVYARLGLAPESEHLCLAILAIEGVVSEAPTANWDGLIETATDELAGPNSPILRVCVIAGDFLEPRRRMRLLKFHGCAVRARDDETTYRSLLVGRQADIEGWAGKAAFQAMRHEMVSLATVRRTLMIGLSAQDINIRDVFRDGRANMAWTWPSHPPAYVFAEDQVGDDQRLILADVYRDAYDANPDVVTEAAQIRAFAKPLLIALVLHVLNAKLATLAGHAPGGTLTGPEIAQLAEGLRRFRDRMAAAVGADRDARNAFVRQAVGESARVLRMFRGTTGAGAYEALGGGIVSQIAGDPNNGTSGLPELAIALGLLGLGEAEGAWTMERADPALPANGSTTVTPTAGTAQRIFLVANQEAALKLQVDGVIADDEPDAVVVCSTRVVARPVRSPRRTLPGSGSSTRWVGVRTLLEEAPDLAGLRRRFREEAIL
jgi:hypothetical protein